MSTNGAPRRATEIGVKRSRKATEPQHLSSFCITSPEEPMNPSSAGNPLSTADPQGTGDQTVNILNLAGVIAMNSLLALNQQSSVGTLPTATQLAAQNPLLANAAKMMLSMNLMNAAAAGASDRLPVATPTADLLSLISSQPEAAAQSVANLQQAMLIQQYAALARSQIPAVNPQLAALQMLKQRTNENGSGQSSDRKRSFPSTDVSGQAEEMRKRVFSDTKVLAAKRKSESISVSHVPFSKDDIERCLERILKEEIYNIYESDSKPDSKGDSIKSSLSDADSKETGCSSSGTSSPIGRKLSIDEILDIIATRPQSKGEGGIASVGSAFRKVSSRSHLCTEPSVREVVSETLAWATSLSPACSSPRISEPDVAPLSQELVNQLRELALSHRDPDEDHSLESIFTTEEQLKRFPVVWQGTLAMKQSETTVQMHLVYGSMEMLTRCLGDVDSDPKNAVPIRVNQRMRLEHAQVQGMVAKMQDAGRFACMICLPCGLSRDEIITNSDIFRTAFIEYFTSKQAAGIAVMPQTATTAGCLVHVFPPGEFPSSYLQYYSPQLYESITARQASYLFVVLTPDESSRQLPSS